MNFGEGTRRLALLLGVVGAILGGIGSYAEFQSLLNQKTQHDRFEQLAASDVVQQERETMSESEGRILFKAPDGSERWVPKDEKDAALQHGGAVIDDGETAMVDRSGIMTIRWESNYQVESIETQDGQTLNPTRAASDWTYLLIALFPIFGFFIPWGAVRAIGWVGAGFVAGQK